MKIYSEEKFVDEIKNSKITLGQSCPKNGQNLLIFDTNQEIATYFGRNVSDKLKSIKAECAEDYALGRELFAQNFDASMYNRIWLVNGKWQALTEENKGEFITKAYDENLCQRIVSNQRKNLIMSAETLDSLPDSIGVIIKPASADSEKFLPTKDAIVLLCTSKEIALSEVQNNGGAHGYTYVSSFAQVQSGTTSQDAEETWNRIY